MTLTGVEDVTEKIDKCPKLKIKKKLKFFVCLTHIVQIAALRAMIVVRYYLNKTVLRLKVPKVMKSYIGEGHDFMPLMSRSFNYLLVAKI